MNLIIRMFTTALILFTMQIVRAEETEQFTLPPKDLMDIGPRASYELYKVIEKVVVETNSRIAMVEPTAKHNQLAARQLAKLSSATYLADALYEKTGPGFPKWMPWLVFAGEKKPFQYKEIWPWNNVYWLVFSQSPFSLLELGPTINMFGHYFGTDKLGHFFMQGHTYLKIYTFLVNHGKTPAKAHDTMILYGQIIEQTYLGTLINSIYSNADLAANYSGWKFYTNLTQSVKIGDESLAPLLEFKNSHWVFARKINPRNLLKPFLSDNLNEALNPCRFSFMRKRLRSQVEKRCPAWISKRGITEASIKAKLKETSTWHGEIYGHWLPTENAVTLSVCFNNRSYSLNNATYRPRTAT